MHNKIQVRRRPLSPPDFPTRLYQRHVPSSSHGLQELKGSIRVFCRVRPAPADAEQAIQFSDEQALKRANFMLKRAYRPSTLARACLLNVHGNLLAARGDDSAALDMHTEAHTLLCAAAQPAHASERHAGWLAACRHGSTWAMVRAGDACSVRSC